MRIVTLTERKEWGWNRVAEGGMAIGMGIRRIRSERK
jgi:hypothetical protein